MDRLRKELADITKDPSSGVNAEPYGDNIRHLKANIKGPVDTPYERGVFAVDIIIPDAYPFEPPKMRFTTKVWHPNVSSQTGAICLDILKDQWSPALTIKVRLPRLWPCLLANFFCFHTFVCVSAENLRLCRLVTRNSCLCGVDAAVPSTFRFSAASLRDVGP